MKRKKKRKKRKKKNDERRVGRKRRRGGSEGERGQVKMENEKWEGADKEKERDGELTDVDPDLVTGTGDYNEKQSTE